MEIVSLVFRALTNADFYNINKPKGASSGGGGQTYIDFPVTEVSIPQWEAFFSGVPSLSVTERTHGPCWRVEVVSNRIFDSTQLITIYQRRKATVSIAGQGISSGKSARVHAWHPSHGFPIPVDQENHSQLPAEGLVVAIGKSASGSLVAFWFTPGNPSVNAIGIQLANSNHPLSQICGPNITPGTSGLLTFPDAPFELARFAEASDESSVVQQLDEDTLILDPNDPGPTYNLTKVRKRNQKAARTLKQLYNGTCQITGEKFSFKTASGRHYSEVHHLVPLGIGGADAPHNMVVVSPLIHRMLHYAAVSPIDLSQIEIAADGSASMPITINGETHAIKWLPQHAGLVSETG